MVQSVKKDFRVGKPIKNRIVVKIVELIRIRVV